MTVVRRANMRAQRAFRPVDAGARPPAAPSEPEREPEPEQEATPVAAQPAPAPRPTPAPAPSTDEDLPETPSREQVQEGLLAVRAGVRACMDRDGRVPVQVTIIGRTGRVSVARVDDAYFGQQPMGGCIARAVRQARFPRFSAPRLNVTYPFTF